MQSLSGPLALSVVKAARWTNNGLLATVLTGGALRTGVLCLWDGESGACLEKHELALPLNEDHTVGLFCTGESSAEENTVFLLSQRRLVRFICTRLKNGRGVLKMESDVDKVATRARRWPQSGRC